MIKGKINEVPFALSYVPTFNIECENELVEDLLRDAIAFVYDPLQGLREASMSKSAFDAYLILNQWASDGLYNVEITSIDISFENKSDRIY